jgi:hypothetical protein
MTNHYHYETPSEAINALRSMGYHVDFNLENNCITSDGNKFGAEHFHITETYRYEGNSDPADEATVYGIESNTGLKGILVTGYGISEDSISTEILRKLSF